MKRTFLLDENMVVVGLDVRRKLARDIWLNIAKNCHRIVLEYQLSRKYYQKLRLAEKGFPSEVGTLLTLIIKQILTNKDKTIWVAPDGPTPLAQLVRHLNDRFLADIAYEAIASGQANHCILVTSDRQTREDFNRVEMQELHIQGVTLETGLKLAK